MAWSSIHAKLHTLLRQRVLLPKRSHILMAVSGGQDSLCLARLLLDLRNKWDWQLGIIHCNHRWRKDADDNATHVMQLAKHWQLPVWVKTAGKPPESEAAARAWRYEIFAGIAREHGCRHVVTGHTASDRAETVLYNLIRGTGIDGVAALPWVRSLDTVQPAISLVRPLLSLTRTQTAQFCHQHQLPIWEDSSNQNLSYRRNRIRQELLPYLRTHFNPQVERSLSQLAEITTADILYIEEAATALYQQTIVYLPEKETWELQRDRLLEAPLALQRRVIRQLLQNALPEPPNFHQIEKLVLLLQAPNGSKTDPYPGGWLAQVCKPVIHLAHQ
ncbi:MAG: tRNA lysidine(34) synthetase TilS [Cyanobacteria bacterium J06623_4]